MLCDALQYLERSGRFFFSKQIDLQLKVIAPLGGAIDRILTYENAGGEEDGLKRQERGKQRKRIIVDGPWMRSAHGIECNPQAHSCALENNEVDCTDEPANGMKYPMMRRKRLLVFLFKLKNGFNIAPRRGR